MNRSIYLAGIADAEGNADPTVEAGAQALAAHWSQVHAGVPSQRAARDQSEEHIQKVQGDVQWRFSDTQFYAALDALRDSAPGPDGLRYSA
eukprot:459721-Pyramimonas_sp.AAC.1